ncbi:hypothetical protein D0864_08653 [Hortaea werneckii]|uniref:Uncharacterized protein n=1 Tax=Hortaea werneckii TaxID=91943 RepID=A0A3M7EUV3_HORWE|nr:hypothetical protein D0864_08653 [Hortaea werneckii]
MEADLFAVVVTGGLDAKRVETFFRKTYQKACQMDCSENLVLVDSSEDLGNKMTPKPKPTQPPISRLPRSTGLSLEVIAQEIAKTANELPGFVLSSQLFAVLDERSAREDNGLIVQVRNDGIETVRVHFDTIAAEITRISMITFDIGETIDFARNAPDGVFRTETPKPY